MGEEGEKLERESETEACGSGVTVMETPDRNRITHPVSKFEVIWSQIVIFSDLSQVGFACSALIDLDWFFVW